MKKKKQNKSPSLKVRITGYKLKPEQVHRTSKTHNRRKTKKIIVDTLKIITSGERID